MSHCGTKGATMFIKKKKVDVSLAKDFENAIAENETLKAFLDYNIMMGNIEDPTEEESEEEEA